MKNIKKLKLKFPELLEQVTLAPYSTFQIGGPADLFYKLQDVDKLPDLINSANSLEVPYLIIGGGSNILFPDAGVRGLVIRIEDKKYQFNDNVLSVNAGAIVAEVLMATIKEGYTGLDEWVGLPGTFGAAVRGNAGCNGLETKDFLISAKIFDPETGNVEVLENKDFQFNYRESLIKHSKKIVLSAKFKIKERTITREEQMTKIAKIRKARIDKQPFGATTGSFFKNPLPDKPAGLLIDQVGLKGTKIGNAMISDKHGNFFLNLGGAKASEIVELCALAQKKVYEKFQIKLEPEVMLVKELVN